VIVDLVLQVLIREAGGIRALAEVVDGAGIDELLDHHHDLLLDQRRLAGVIEPLQLLGQFLQPAELLYHLAEEDLQINTALGRVDFPDLARQIRHLQRACTVVTANSILHRLIPVQT
jgi:hypothetical protein